MCVTFRTGIRSISDSTFVVRTERDSSTEVTECTRKYMGEKRYRIFGTQPPIDTPSDGLCTEDTYSGIIYKERLFDLNNRRKKP